MNPFDCTDIQATLSGLIDDQVDDQTRHLAERHLAQCDSCRALIGKAESLNDLIAMDAATFAPHRLSDRFVNGVLAHTVYADSRDLGGWNWINRLGWVAAAACLGLAATIWIMDRRPVPHVMSGIASGEAGQRDSASQQYAGADGSALRSFTYNHPLQPAVFTASNRTVIESESMLDDSLRRRIDEQLALVEPTQQSIDRLSEDFKISEADGDTLHAAARLLDMIAESDLQSFADIDLARRIAVYDELPDRLAAVRIRLHPSQRAPVLAAESIILRLINGPMDVGDLQLMHDTVASLDLATSIGAISTSRGLTTSL